MGGEQSAVILTIQTGSCVEPARGRCSNGLGVRTLPATPPSAGSGSTRPQ